MEEYGLDVEEAKKSNLMLTGLTGSGKTRLAWAHTDELMRSGFQVIVIDPVSVWRDSPIPYLVKVEPYTRIKMAEIVESKSVVFDISRLLIDNQLEFLDMLSKHLFTSRVDATSPKQTMLVIEEASTFIKYLRTQVSQNIYRLAFTGRNYGIRLMYIDPRLNSIPSEFRFLAGQQFHGFANEVNVLNKIRRLYGKQWEETMKELNVGEFIRIQAGRDPTLIKVPLYQPKTKPKPYVSPKPIKKPHQRVFKVTVNPVNESYQKKNTQTQVIKKEPTPRFDLKWWISFLTPIALIWAFFAYFV